MFRILNKYSIFYFILILRKSLFETYMLVTEHVTEWNEVLT